MKQLLSILLTLIIFVMTFYVYSNFTGKLALLGMFFCGLLLGIFLMIFVLNVKNQRLNSYKRELEKESINSTESSSRVKVLEAKIEVLENDLEKKIKEK